MFIPADFSVPVQTSEKRRTGTIDGLVQTPDGDIYKKKRLTLVEFERKDHCYKKYIKNHSLIVIKIKDKSHPLKVALYKTTAKKGFGFNCHKTLVLHYAYILETRRHITFNISTYEIYKIIQKFESIHYQVAKI